MCLIPSNYFLVLTGYHAESMLPTFGKSSSVGVSIAENLPDSLKDCMAWLPADSYFSLIKRQKSF